MAKKKFLEGFIGLITSHVIRQKPKQPVVQLISEEIIIYEKLVTAHSALNIFNGYIKKS